MHRKMRRPIANLYSVANLTSFEPLVLSTMQRFFARLDELFTDEARELDLCQWLQFFTFDVMGEVTFSRRLGFLEEGADVEEIMANNWKYFQMAAPVSVSPKVNGTGLVKTINARKQKEYADAVAGSFLER